MVPPLLDMEEFTDDEWKEIANTVNNHRIDSLPQGTNKIADTAGKRHSVAGYIISGTFGSLGSFPWQAYVVQDMTYICGGSLIHQQWVLTAAHCALE